jgi:ribosomal protein S18 acetylase RimI-like enzyme
MTSAEITVVEADLDQPAHQQAILELTDSYACDPMGGATPLSPAVRGALISGLRRHPTTRVFLAFAGGQAVGIASCFTGFSTFHAQPLINIHDLAVRPGRRGQGIGRQLLVAVERRARQMGCCKLSLEVGERNGNARALYEAQGFRQAGTDEPVGPMVFMTKKL